MQQDRCRQKELNVVNSRQRTTSGYRVGIIRTDRQKSLAKMSRSPIPPLSFSSCRLDDQALSTQLDNTN
ncbi:hypothetical protein SprV_0200928100 [Sparganum proliferum]